MKVRESGMPEPLLWESFFDSEAILTALGIDGAVDDAIEFGCGYGTFTLPVARRIRGQLTTFDIDPAMISHARRRATEVGLTNIRFCEADFMTAPVAQGSSDCALLFNILHTADPVALLQRASDCLRAGGMVAAIHWNHDPETPRGPPMAIRPQPHVYPDWAQAVGLDCGPMLNLPPYHYGFIMRKPPA